MRVRLLALLIPLLSLPGCATFHGGLDPVDLSGQAPTGLPVKVSFDHFTPALFYIDKHQWEANLIRAFRTSRMFDEVHRDPYGRPGPQDRLYIRVRLENDKGPLAYTVGACSGFLSGLTLFILPGYERTPYFWKAEIYQNGVKTREFSYKAATHTVFHLTMVPFIGVAPYSYDGYRIVEEFVQTLLSDARAEGAL